MKKGARKKKKDKFRKMPDFIPPMLATLVKESFSDSQWLFEVKWDGYRALAFIDKGEVSLKSRNNLYFHAFQPIINDLKKINGQLILDGEVVVLDTQGKSHFQLMQNYQKTKQGALAYYVFDLLYKDGEDLRSLPLLERKKILKNVLKQCRLSTVRYSQHTVEFGKEFFKAIVKENMEGMMGKKLTSTYQSGRSQEWVKVKTSMRQEVVIGGFTEPTGSRKNFGALLVGVYNKKRELVYVGHVGGGFNEALLDDVFKQLKPLIQSKSPFKKVPKGNTKETWVKPKLLCEVTFSEWTKENIMRQPIFQGLRTDKSPKVVTKERAKPIPISKKSSKSNDSNTKKIVLTHEEKIYWPKEKYTKGNLLTYYESIASYILPYLKDRPIMLHRFPNGIEGQEFYQKDLKIAPPAGIRTFPVKHEGKIDHYLLIDNVESLLYAVNLGSIDLHPFMARCEDVDYPDYCVIDLDPHEIPFKKAIEVALFIHETLDKIKVKHFCKTSGKKGLHILIPLHAKYTFEQSKQFAEILGHYVHVKFPKTTSLERVPKKRLKKIYIDCFQNRFGQTIVAPFSVRPVAGACVSTPLEWDEVNDRLDPTKFTIKTIPQRLKGKKDTFRSVLTLETNLQLALKRLQKISSAF